MRKLRILPIVGCCLLMTVSGCGTMVSEEQTKSIRIGVTVYDQYDYYVGQMMECFADAANAAKQERGVNVTIDTYNAAGSQSTQNDQVSTMLEKRCDVICVNLVDRTDPTQIIEMAREEDVPVIFFNRELVEEDIMRWSRLYYVGAKALESGIMEGQLATDYCLTNPACDRDGDGRIQYVMLEGEAGHQDAIVRTEYSVRTMDAAGIEIDRVDSTIANWSREQAKTKAAQLIEQQKNVELYLCNNDAMALGVIDAYESVDTPRDAYPAIFGIDGIDEGLAAVEEGTMTATVYNDKEGQAQSMFELAYRLATGGDVGGLDLDNGHYIRLPYAKVTTENVGEYLKQSQR